VEIEDPPRLEAAVVVVDLEETVQPEQLVLLLPLHREVREAWVSLLTSQAQP
jgi:hypothetical protein